ncbi:hypothetical protein GLIP_3949 [Aliiglaciecola lipolytica E3]|uniref:Uncharacterized protein n=1 Tax=Aliiglaciecola lipolytica E3 TaxID=1127673 RepID=K6YZC0_9ALTE|nr:hypothetical protein GLIP_3949 [Aliiglaciecola lipolytica E3]
MDNQRFPIGSVELSCIYLANFQTKTGSFSRLLKEYCKPRSTDKLGFKDEKIICFSWVLLRTFFSV